MTWRRDPNPDVDELMRYSGVRRPPPPPVGYVPRPAHDGEPDGPWLWAPLIVLLLGLVTAIAACVSLAGPM